MSLLKDSQILALIRIFSFLIILCLLLLPFNTSSSLWTFFLIFAFVGKGKGEAGLNLRYGNWNIKDVGEGVIQATCQSTKLVIGFLSNIFTFLKKNFNFFNFFLYISICMLFNISLSSLNLPLLNQKNFILSDL